MWTPWALQDGTDLIAQNVLTITKKNISDLRHGDYSYGAKCRFSLQLRFVMHSLQIIPTRNQHAFVYYFNKKYIKKHKWVNRNNSDP